jgi:two-component system nitrate/nitrite response regulator NarL
MVKVRLLLLDDHALFRESLARLLAAEPEFEVVAHCSSIEEAWEILRNHAVDVVLLDFDLGKQRAPEFLAGVREMGLKLRILVVTAGITAGDAARILDEGASGVFLKHGSPALLSEAIQKIQAGETWIDQRCLRDLVHAAAKPVPRTEGTNLSERERQVLKGVLEGQSNKEISGGLGISESSVKAALQQLFQKTGVRTRSQLVRIALEKFAGEWGL